MPGLGLTALTAQIRRGEKALTNVIEKEVDQVNRERNHHNNQRCLVPGQHPDWVG